MKLLFAFLLILLPLSAYAAGSRAGLNSGNACYRKGDYNGAQKEYEAVLKKMPDSGIVNFNCGAASYKQADYHKAQEYFSQALVLQDKEAAAKALYNLANSDFKYSLSLEEQDINQAIGQMEAALKHYDLARKADRKDQDAEYNYNIAQKELERLKEKQKEQQQKKDQKQEEQPKQKQQGQKQEQQGQKQEQQGQQQESGQQQEDKQDGANSQKDDGQKLSHKEAVRLLEAYREEEEPKGMYKERVRTVDVGTAEKDW